MACVTGTNIVNDGLVFHFDLENGVKSFKGKPTSNLTTNTPTMAGWAGQYTLVDSNTKTFLIQTTQNNSATTSAWRTWYWDVSSYIGQTITISGYVKFVSETYSTFSSITIGQGNTGSFPVHIAGSDPIDRVTSTTKPLEKTYMSWTGVINTAGLVGFTLWISNVTENYANAVIEISNVQIEVGEFATKFVNGVRLDTASIVDVSPTRSTITAANLTYRQDDTPTFDGTNDYLSIPQPNVQTSPNIWTIEGWIKTGNQTSFFITPNSNGIDNFLRYDAGQQQIVMTVCSAADTNGRGFPTGVGSVPYNTWTHFSASIDNLDVKMHINGELKYSGTETISMSGWTGLWRIGQRGNGTYYLLGELDNLKIYNKALTDAEVKQNFEATRARYGI